MTRYLLRVTDAPGQPSRLYDEGDDLGDAVKACARLAATGFVGGTVQVIDSTIEHPDRNVVHEETRAS